MNLIPEQITFMIQRLNDTLVELAMSYPNHDDSHFMTFTLTFAGWSEDEPRPMLSVAVIFRLYIVPALPTATSVETTSPIAFTWNRFFLSPVTL